MKKTLMYEQLIELYPLFRESMEERRGTEKTESNFITQTLKRSRLPIKTIIDLGGGIGVHAGELLRRGYNVTLFDQSRKALLYAKKKFSGLKIEQGSFETIAVRRTYDAAICMWSTFPYILSEAGRRRFFGWLKSHVRHLIILDEANFYRYLKMKEFHKIYKPVENARFRLTLTRDWITNSKGLRETSYVYTVTDKQTEKMKLIQDQEVQQYLSVEEIQKYLGSRWKRVGLFGDFEQTSFFNKKTSPRIISVFRKKI